MAEKQKVIITDYLHPVMFDGLIDMGFEVDLVPDITNEALSEIIDRYTGLVISTKIKVTQVLMDKAEKLRFIARAGSGMENIDSLYAHAKGIHVVSSPDGNANAVAEHTIGMLLAMLNKLHIADREMRNGIWHREENRGEELDGKTVGIIGYGHAGSRLAHKLAGFDAEVLAYDKYKSGFGTEKVREVTLKELQKYADIITFHVPHTPQTHHYLNDDFIAKCARSFYLINTSRGKVVDTDALLRGLDSGKVKLAALDVYENEQFDTLTPTEQAEMAALRSSEKVLLTPHIAGWTHQSFYKLSGILVEKIKYLLPEIVK
ncbi:MAG: NAD(P)-dependent oxidoreductase [Chitinophagales bacterium]